ncbi:exonuclease domain-containing protein, partial [Mycobacterium sp. E3247]|uniref:exonuclease domain-containing protein n=1 Tax=Mycobacterium sp. E3247 TaxID=1856864 RepID=UPI0021010061
MGAGGATQLSFADLGSSFETPDVLLRDTTFVVVDLETTGGRTKSTGGSTPDAITEIGAVKVRGGTVLGEFATLVDPKRSIPPQIVQLTGITTAMVSDAPTIDAVLPMFLELAEHGAAADFDRTDLGDGVGGAAAGALGAPAGGLEVDHHEGRVAQQDVGRFEGRPQVGETELSRTTCTHAATVSVATA